VAERLRAFGRAFFGRALALLPPSFGPEAREEMRATFDLRQRERRGTGSLLVLMLRELSGLAETALRARLGASCAPPQGASPMETFVQDLRHGLRSLLRSPPITLTVVTVIAVGVAASTAIFSAVNAVLLRPLPFRDPGRLVVLWEHNPDNGWTQVNAAPANALDWRERVGAFEDVAFYASFTDGLTWVAEGGAEEVLYATVSGNFFDVLGVPLALGDGLGWDDTFQGDGREVVLSWDAWRTRFGGDPSVVGRVLDFAGVEVRVAGVAPEGFRFPDDEAELWLPFDWPDGFSGRVSSRRAHWVWPVARLRSGVTLDQARSELENVMAAMEIEFPATNTNMGAGIGSLHDFLVGDRTRPLLVLLGAVGLLLLIACSNVGNLLLVRAQGRAGELALRRAMGAGSGRLARLVLIESALLAAAGGALGFALGVWGVRLLDGMRSLTLPGVAGLSTDQRVVAFTLLVTSACALLFGLPPALRAGRAEPGDALREGVRAGVGRGRLHATHALVTVEVALSVVLVVAAGLMVRSFLGLRSVDPGVRVEGVMTFRVVVPDTRYASADEVVGLFTTLEERLEAIPGVEGVAMARLLSPGATGWSSDFSEESWPAERVGHEILHREVSPDYFDVMDVPLVAGRAFTGADGTTSAAVVVVNEAFVAEHFPGQDVLGMRIAFDAAPTENSVWRTIVGVVGDERQASLSQLPSAEVFAPLYQDVTRGAAVVMTTRGDPASLMPAARAALAEVDPLLPPTEIRPMEGIVGEARARDRFLLVLVALFGSVALVLAGVGIYGVMAQATRRRTREIGIRVALGAGAGEVRAMVLRQGMGMVGVGVVVGLVGAFLGARLLGALLYQVAPTDPVTFLVVPLLLGFVALLACWVPARRATRVDPVGALRAE
jgi:putative ABC transport system permease protein